MASSNNLASSSVEAWSFRPCSFPDSWISEAFTRDTDALTKALQESLYSNSNTEPIVYNDASSFQQLIIKPEAVPSSHSLSDHKRGNCIGNGKITKRKSRASKRSPTLYIAADPANFRQMVQQVTGIQFTGEAESEMRMPPVFKPEPHRPRNPIHTCILPTLDTSESWLGPRTREPLLDDAASAKDNQTFRSFPTLESWN